MFIAAGVCTPQGVWIRAMERHGSLLTKTLKRTKAQQPEGHKRQGVLYVYVRKKKLLTNLNPSRRREKRRTIMAKVGWSAGIDYVSGALSKPSKNGQHSCQKMLLGTHRTAATTSNNCNRLYLRPKIERSTPPTVNELFMRQRFSAVKAAVKARSEDLSKVDADQAAFIAQKDTAGGKRTMNAYLWSLECAKYDETHPRG